MKLWQKFEPQIFKYSLAAVLLALPLYPKFPFIQVPGTYVSIRLEDFLIAIITIIWIFWAVRNKKEVFSLGLVGKIILVYFAAGLLSTLSAILITHTVVPHIGILHYLRRIEYLFIFFLAATQIKKETQVLFYFEVIFWVIVGVTVYGIGQRYLGWPVISTQNLEFAKGFALKLTPGARLNSTFAGHYDLAAFAVITIPLFISLLVAPLKKWYKFIGLSGFLLSFWLLLASSSRISFPAYLVSSVFVLAILRRFKLAVVLVVFSLVFVLSSSELSSRYMRTINVYLAPLGNLISFKYRPPTEPPFVIEPTETPSPSNPTLPPIGEVSPLISPISTPTRRPKLKRETTPTPLPAAVIVEERSTEIRLNAEWPRAIRAFKKNPLLGTGFSSITLATDNDFLRILGEIGILGTVSFFLIFVGLIKKSSRNLFGKSTTLQRALSVGIIGSLIGFLINATFIDVFEASKIAPVFWGLAGLLFALNHQNEN